MSVNRRTPNQALQRTAPCVTAPASAAALPPAMQVPRRTPRSLSLGSLGSIARHMKLETLQEVREFVSREIGVPVARLKPESRLLHDLGVDGDDAGDLFQHFSARFHVDISAFQFARHFGPEAGFNPLHFIYCRLFARHREQDDLPVTIQDLAEAAEAGVWRYAV